MSRKSPQASKPGPEAEAVSELRDGLERAHELVVEAKLAIRQLGEEQPLPAPVVPNRIE